MTRCQYEGCPEKAYLALYQLNAKGFTKKWVNVCDGHDRLIAEANSQLRREHPGVVWIEKIK